MAQNELAALQQLSPAEAARQNPELEGIRLVNAALDPTPHAFRAEFQSITDPVKQAAALKAAEAYELKRENEGVTNPALPTVAFFEANGVLGQVVVHDPKHNRIAYDMNGNEEKTKKEKGGDMVKAWMSHIPKN